MSVASGAPSLANAPVSLLAMREFDKSQLIALLDRMPGGNIALAIDPKIFGYIGQIIERPLLQSHGVSRILKLDANAGDADVPTIFYILRPQVELCKHIVNHVIAHRNAGKNVRHVACFVPRRTLLCDRVFDEAGAYRDVQFEEFAFDLVPLEDDVLSMELQDDLRECRVDGDRTSLYYVARAIMKLQTTYGIIPTVHGKGLLSRTVADMMLRMRREMGADEPQSTPEIAQLVLIDREVDMVTPMMTMLTYEGMIDETMGIINGHIDLDYDVVVSPLGPDGQKRTPQPGKKTIFPLNNNDRVFAEMRNMNCSAIGPYLNRRAKEIDSYYKAMHEQRTVTQLADWMKKLKAAQGDQNFLRIHTHITERIIAETRKPEFRKQIEIEQSLIIGADLETPYVEDCVYRGLPLVKVLRLLVLQSLTCGGIKPKIYDQLKRDIVQAYGFDTMFTLQNLEKLGLLKKQDGKNAFATMRKSLRLCVDDINEAEPNDIAYTFSGYAPLSVRLIDAMSRPGGMRAIDEVLRLIPGPHFEFEQPLPAGVQPPIQSASGKAPVTLVFFIGGVTFAEIAALRYLARNSSDGRGTDFLIGTTKVVNGRSLMESMLEFLPESPIVQAFQKQKEAAAAAAAASSK